MRGCNTSQQGQNTAKLRGLHSRAQRAQPVAWSKTRSDYSERDPPGGMGECVGHRPVYRPAWAARTGGDPRSIRAKFPSNAPHTHTCTRPLMPRVRPPLPPSTAAVLAGAAGWTAAWPGRGERIPMDSRSAVKRMAAGRGERVSI